MTKQEFIESLKIIDYSTKGVYPNEYIVDNLGNQTSFRVLNDRIEMRIGSCFSLCAHYEKITVDKIDKSISVQSANDDETTGFFLLFRKV
jgi:hypothetical protein